MLSAKSDNKVIYQSQWLMTTKSQLLDVPHNVRYGFAYMGLRTLPKNYVTDVMCNDDYFKDCAKDGSIHSSEKLIGYADPLNFYLKDRKFKLKRDSISVNNEGFSYLIYYDNGKFHIFAAPID